MPSTFKSLKKGAQGCVAGQPFDNFICYVSGLQRREYKHIGLALEDTVRSLQFGDLRDNRGIELKFTVQKNI